MIHGHLSYTRFSTTLTDTTGPRGGDRRSAAVEAHAGAKLKAKLRKAAQHTVQRLWRAVREIFDSVARTEGQSYFAAVGYDVDRPEIALIDCPEGEGRTFESCRVRQSVQ